MGNIDELLNVKRRYEELKLNITSIIDKLDGVIEKLEIPSDEIKKVYNVDSISVDEGNLSSIRQNLINKRYNLKNYVLQTINQKLYELEIEIESAG